MPTVTFKPAVRKGAHVIITAYGESGCGKTLSLLRLGRGLVGPQGKLVMIDSETGRGMIYADAIPGGYDYAELTPPFTPERYIEAIADAEEAGYDALVLDSGSHEWIGIGGILEIADEGKSNSGKALSGLIKWAKPKARHKRYVQALLNSRMHLLISLRAKEKMVQKGDAIVSEGYVPIQDKRFIFETTVQLFLPVYPDRRQLGIPRVEKCPADLVAAFPDGQQISEETGRIIGEWVSGGEAIDHAFEALRRAGEESAAKGSKALDAWILTVGRLDKEKLKPIGANLRSIAAAADRDAADRAEEQRTFGDSPAQQTEEKSDGLGGPARGIPVLEKRPDGTLNWSKWGLSMVEAIREASGDWLAVLGEARETYATTCPMLVMADIDRAYGARLSDLQPT
jgi:hypothetical protein